MGLSGVTPDATSARKGKILLAGSIGGTADLPRLVEAINTQTTTYTATTSDDVILVSAGSDWTLALYTAVGNTGRMLQIKKTDNNTNKVTVDPNASETIDGQTTVVLMTQYSVIEIVSDGANWQLL